MVIDTWVSSTCFCVGWRECREVLVVVTSPSHLSKEMGRHLRNDYSLLCLSGEFRVPPLTDFRVSVIGDLFVEHGVSIWLFVFVPPPPSPHVRWLLTVTLLNSVLSLAHRLRRNPLSALLGFIWNLIELCLITFNKMYSHVCHLRLLYSGALISVF